MFRACKGTPNENAFRTLMAGCVLTIPILLSIDPALRFYEQHIAPKPWVVATVEIVPVAGAARPAVLYGVDAKSLVSGRWKAWVEPKYGDVFVRGCRGSGPGNYSPTQTEKRLWKWGDWLGRDCALPPRPFRLCVSYSLETPRGAREDFGPYCSEEWSDK